MNVLALASGGINSTAAASVLLHRQHKISLCHVSLSSTAGRDITCQQAGILGVPHIHIERPITNTLKLPYLLCTVVDEVLRGGFDAICVGLHYTNNQPYASQASLLYLRRLLETAAPRDSHIRLLTPVYEYPVQDIKTEIEDFNGLYFTQ